MCPVSSRVSLDNGADCPTYPGGTKSKSYSRADYSYPGGIWRTIYHFWRFMPSSLTRTVTLSVNLRRILLNLTEATQLRQAQQNEPGRCRFSFDDCQFARFVLPAMYFDEFGGHFEDAEFRSLPMGNQECSKPSDGTQVHLGAICS